MAEITNDEGKSKEEQKMQMIITAQIAFDADRCDDMADCMHKATVIAGGHLSREERDLLSVAFKNATAVRRLSWRVIAASEQGEKDARMKDASKMYRHQIEGELLAICQLVVGLLDDYLIPASNDSNSEVFYYKMKGDYCRYRAELLLGKEREDAAAESEAAYRKAEDISSANLSPLHPLRLGLSLNHSVLYYEIFRDSVTACSIASKAITEAEQLEYDSTADDTDDEALSILKLLKDNFTIWNHDYN
ncbi:PREDICTED: 14-3-3 protein zeta-like [Amphimedon queenslandica]|uniref:14-3-3 domain-containing protein n=1 Tax=Amphimedon queenslandica TaxID=400682 RepID=A0A1X7V465_AMPQE|nr:PREDICTED: 14-3-3 protein zeta-like [Amphimedon queenslandica]|eukprot:XP_003385866.1 PREDICTED: 14-3-3 protein zeta-like [Amphimedon queenslandica]